MLIQIAHIVAGKGNTNLSRFFQRLSKRKEYNVAIMALARKLICLVHHLLINQELYQEENREKRESKTAKSDPTSSYSPEDQLEDKVAAIVDAFYHLKARGQKRSSDWGG